MDATVVSQRKGRIVLDVRLTLVRDNGIYMRVEGINPSDPIRNIRVLLPGTEDRANDGMPFHPVRSCCVFACAWGPKAANITNMRVHSIYCPPTPCSASWTTCAITPPCDSWIGRTSHPQA